MAQSNERDIPAQRILGVKVNSFEIYKLILSSTFDVEVAEEQFPVTSIDREIVDTLRSRF